MTRNKITHDSIITLALFLGLVIIFYCVGYWLIFRLERATPLMLSVGFATLATCAIRNRDISTLGWSWGEWRYQRISYLLPLLIILITHLIIWNLGLGEWYNIDFTQSLKADYNLDELTDAHILAFHFLISATVSFLMLLPSVLGEEIAWRGFLVPELAKFMSFTGVAFVSGLLWAMWHWPLILTGLSGNGETPIHYQLLCFTVFIMSISFVMTYLRLKTNSLWTAVIFHMSINLFLQKVFIPLTAQNSNSVWFIDETGAVLATISLSVALYFWRKGLKEFGS